MKVPPRHVWLLICLLSTQLVISIPFTVVSLLELLTILSINSFVHSS